MIEITHKETNKRIDNLNLDSVLNVDSLKKVGDNIDNILLETWKEQPQYFVYDGGDGEIPLKNLGTIREEVGDVEAFIAEDGNRIGNGRLQTTMVSHHKIPTKLPRISKILFDLFGYDNPTQKQHSEFIKRISSFCVFWDPLYTNIIDVDKFDNTTWNIKFEDGLHLDSDEFIWFKVNQAKTLNVMNLERERYKTLKHAYLAPQGFWYGVPKDSFGVSVRLGLANHFFIKEDWMSEIHLNLIDYINEFDIKVKIVRNTQDGMHWHMIDYSEAEAFRVKGFVPNSHSGNWMGPGSKKNIPNGL